LILGVLTAVCPLDESRMLLIHALKVIHASKIRGLRMHSLDYLQGAWSMEQKTEIRGQMSEVSKDNPGSREQKQRSEVGRQSSAKTMQGAGSFLVATDE
jgi:hypothetical protein